MIWLLVCAGGLIAEMSLIVLLGRQSTGDDEGLDRGGEPHPVDGQDPIVLRGGKAPGSAAREPRDRPVPGPEHQGNGVTGDVSSQARSDGGGDR